MPILNLLADLDGLVQRSPTEAEFRSAVKGWVESLKQGPVGLLLADMKQWSGRVGPGPSREKVSDLVRALDAASYTRRAETTIGRFAEVMGVRPAIDIVLVAGFGRPEGYSRFDRGRNTIFIGIDHPRNLGDPRHFDVILAHELTHAVRDPTPEVLAEYGGSPGMTHDDFIERYPFREHLVSEALATSVSEVAYPGLPDGTYLFFDPEEVLWCDAHRGLIAERMRQALADSVDYGTFYHENVVAPGSPSCCDYYFGFHLGRFAERELSPAVLARLPARAFLDRFLERFVRDLVLRDPGEIAAVEGAAAHAGRAFFAAYRADPERPVRETEALQAAVAREPLEFAGDPYEVYAHPLFLGREEVRRIREATEGILGLAEKVTGFYVADPAVRAFFGFPPELEALILAEPGYRPGIPCGRFDSYWDGERLVFLELNTNGTAGMNLAERVNDLHAALPGVRELLRAQGARRSHLRRRLLDALLAAWRQASPDLRSPARGREAPRRVAIVDWSHVPTRGEFYHLQTYFRSQGVLTVVVDPKDLVYDGDELVTWGDERLPVDLIYRRLTTEDFLTRFADLAHLGRAATDRRVVMVGGFRADVAHSKKLFAFLSDDRWSDRFTRDERRLIEAHIPWTRVLAPSRTFWRKRAHNIVDIALKHRESFVLKPCHANEGRGVVLGAETAADPWAKEVGERLGKGHLLQERIPAPTRTVPCPGPFGVRAIPLHLHLGEYVFGGRLAGFWVRVSEELVVSQRSRERTIPWYAVR